LSTPRAGDDAEEDGLAVVAQRGFIKELGVGDARVGRRLGALAGEELDAAAPVDEEGFVVGGGNAGFR